MSRNLLFIFLVAFALLLTDVHAQSHQDSYSRSFQAGLDLFERGLFAESIPLFREAIENSENEIKRETADFFIVRAFTQIDSLGTDIHVDRFVQSYPGSNRVAVLLREVAEQHLERREYNYAIRRMDQALNFPQSYMNRAELYYSLAEVAVQNGDYDLARRYFLELSDEHRRSIWSPAALYSRGRLYLEQEQFPEAADAFELLRERHPNTAMARRIGTALGESYYQQRRYEEAIQAFRDAIPYLDDENRTKAFYLIAESYNAINAYSDATRYYREFLRRVDDPHEARIAHYGLGWVFHKQDIFHWAARSFAEASSGDDDIARRALYYKAVNQKLSGRLNDALNTFREFGDRFDEGVFFEHAHFEWAVTAFELGLFNEAIEVLLPLARNFQQLENPGQILTFLGEAYHANGEYSRAIEAFDLASEIDDIDPALKRQARFQRAWVMYFNQAYAQSQPEFELVYDEAPGTELGQEALFWSADANFQIGEYGRAAEQFGRFIRNYPDHEMIGAAKYSLGWSYFMMGDFANATGPLIDFLNNYEPPTIALFPYDTDTRLRIGDAFFAQGKYREALEFYNATIGADPGGDYAMYQVANSHYRMNRNFEAVTQFRRLLRIYPFSRLREQAQYNIAYIYLNTGNFDQAIEEFETVIRRFPGTEWAARAQYNIGDSHFNAGRFEEAIAAYNRVLEDFPRSQYIIDAIDGIQFAQLSAGMSDASTDILEEFLADNPTSTTADRLRFRQAENVFQSGDYDGAVREFRQYLRITNNRNLMPEAYFNMADAFQRLNRKQEAIETYETLINDFPDSDRKATSLAELGRLLYEQGNYNESIRRFEQLAEHDSRFEQEAFLGVGNANLALQNNTGARQNFERVLSINPNNDSAKNGLGKVLLRDGRVDEARRFFVNVAENNTTEIGAEAQLMIGETFLAEGDRDSALEAFSRVRVLFGPYAEWVAEAQYKTAEIYIRQGRRGDAISLLNSIIDSYPDTDGARKARRLLQSN
ncbi:MAG: tetratricopeptide repeat protein [Balneolaceae bacterium]|nr:MAG: tetratricopeptide repeat protein [Balneolaceae bacterium]